MQESTSPESSATLAAVSDAPFLSTRQKIETLHLAALARKPNADEIERFVSHVNSGGPKNDPKAALGDVLWVLLNSTEFLLNH
jgi:hypothetical protein